MGVTNDGVTHPDSAIYHKSKISKSSIN